MLGMSVVWLNGELMSADEARIPVLDRGVIWGYGLFETLRAYGGRLWAFEEHYERLRAGSEVLELPIPPAGVVREAMDAVLAAGGLSDAGVRVTVTRGAGPPDPHAEPTDPPNAFVSAWPLRDYSALYELGASLVSLPGGGRPLAGVKSTSYAASVAGRLVARRAGADDALFVGPAGRVLETTGANVMAVRGDRLTTPAIQEAILPGVTRRTVLGVAVAVGLRPEEAPLNVADLFESDEVLLTSTLREVYPARSIDGRECGRGPLAARLRAAMHESILTTLDGGSSV
jgi:branched-chain amino acid aminotransferase